MAKGIGKGRSRRLLSAFDKDPNGKVSEKRQKLEEDMEDKLLKDLGGIHPSFVTQVRSNHALFLLGVLVVHTDLKLCIGWCAGWVMVKAV